MQARVLGFSHPCFENAPVRMGRMHLPVAPRCNIQCSFCNPASGESCVHGCVPGLTKEVLTPRQALLRVKSMVEDRHLPIEIIGIAGPGEPLYNEETFETLEMLHAKYPQIHLCLSTNGLLLPRLMDRIIRCGVETLTVTVNSCTVPVARMVYNHVEGKSRDEDFLRLMEQQLQGIELAASKGLRVKVNSVFIPDENEKELPEIARIVKSKGACIHNILPLIPRKDAQKRRAPDNESLKRVRSACAKHIEEFERCRHCRADAVIGIPKEILERDRACKA